MGAKTRITFVDREFLFRPGGSLSPDAGAKAVAAFARERIGEAEQQNQAALGYSPEKETFVNGARSTDFDSVKPGQAIVAVFDIGSNVVQYVWDMVHTKSPVLSGEFKKSHRIYADGSEVAGPSSVGDAREIIITSVAPYARKIERGQSKQAPEGVFEAVAALAMTKYGAIAKVRFTYRAPMGGSTALDKWAAKHSAGSRKQAAQYAKDTRQPAIMILMK